MVQARDGARLTLETLAQLAIARQVIGRTLMAPVRSSRVSAAR
jgi:hypothetical protein